MEAAPGCPFKHASIAGVSRTTAAHGFALRSQGSNENSIVLFFFFFRPRRSVLSGEIGTSFAASSPVYYFTAAWRRMMTMKRAAIFC